MENSKNFNIMLVKEACYKINLVLDDSFLESDIIIYTIDNMLFNNNEYIDNLSYSQRQKVEDFIISCYWKGEEEFCSMLSEVTGSKKLVNAIENGDHEYIANVIINLADQYYEEGAFV